MKIAICWTHISGYMAACWRALAAHQEIDLGIIAFQSNVPNTSIAFADDVVRGLNVRLLAPAEQQDQKLLASLVSEARPDIVVLPGWAYRAHRMLVDEPSLRNAKFIMTMDTPWRGTLRQRLGRYRIAGFLDRMNRIVVPGERAWQLARVLGFPEEKIRRGLYGVDYDSFAPLHAKRLKDWPGKFLFAGRYEQSKGIDVLLAGYRAYRASVKEPWPLTCCGTGALRDAIGAEPAVKDLGFVQPSQQPDIFLSHGVFVLPSLYDPWPLAIVEACAAGLPVIHSEACGSAVELVRPFYNGLGVATGNPNALAGAFRWCHEHHPQLPQMGQRATHLAAAYSAQAWAARWLAMFEELMQN